MVPHQATQMILFKNLGLRQKYPVSLIVCACACGPEKLSVQGLWNVVFFPSDQLRGRMRGIVKGHR